MVAVGATIFGMAYWSALFMAVLGLVGPSMVSVKCSEVAMVQAGFWRTIHPPSLSLRRCWQQLQGTGWIAACHVEDH